LWTLSWRRKASRRTAVALASVDAGSNVLQDRLLDLWVFLDPTEDRLILQQPIHERVVKCWVEPVLIVLEVVCLRLFGELVIVHEVGFDLVEAELVSLGEVKPEYLVELLDQGR